MILRRRVMVSGDEGIDYSKQYLTIVSLEDNNNIGWSCSESDNSYRKRISYSTDGGATWTTKQSSSLTFVTLNTWEKLMLKYYNSSTYQYNYFYSTKEFNLEGNIMSLITSGDFTSAKTISDDFAFNELFRNCSKLKSAENLVLPATTLSMTCYTGMFKGCTSLTTPPTILPATTLTNYCYRDMFDGCTALTSVPELPATTLAVSCYHRMFKGCSSLTTAPELPAATLVANCYQEMFRDCGSLNYIKCLATNITNTCTYNWVSDVAASGTFVKASGMTRWKTGGSGIPSGWTVQDA